MCLWCFLHSAKLEHGLKLFRQVCVVISNVNHQVAADPPLFVNISGQQINQHNPAQTTELSGLMDPLLPGQKSQRSHNVPKLLQLTN